MVKWKPVYTKQTQKDAKKITAANLKDKTINVLNVLEENPFKSPPPNEKLVGDLTRAYSRRINIQHKIVYQIYEQKRIVKIIRIWTHYE